MMAPERVRREIRARKFPQFVIASDGSLWYWNCGYYRKGVVYHNSHRKTKNRPLSICEFAQTIGFATEEEREVRARKTLREVKGLQIRSYMPRTFFMDHNQYGRCEVRESNGVHAIVIDPIGVWHEVHCTNLKYVPIENVTSDEKTGARYSKAKQAKRKEAARNGAAARQQKSAQHAKDLLSKYLKKTKE